MDTLVAIFANSLVSSLLLFQSIRLLKRRKARFLSIGLLLLMLPATLCWAVFGYLDNKDVMLACGAGTFLLNVVTLFLYIQARSFRKTAI
ncbi:hypothetical protein D3H65_10570 [Paraflavitalea soli]|uniref:MtN3 and saliva related transmembrane protein n=1 Tax=Paraflavitalea soli TaxID=2315862 RepID=A0A3B7MIX2_9BACT|nr:hypothetical protein [Paraflavitalea soli]AXY74394.1 hypothetical protein D3H65_10570 [Paraflavitalea soli]